MENTEKTIQVHIGPSTKGKSEVLKNLNSDEHKNLLTDLNNEYLKDKSSGKDNQVIPD